MKLKKIKPLYTRIVTTMNTYVEDNTDANGIIDVTRLKQGITEYQTVLEVGTSVRFIKPGDIVCINPERYAVKKYQPNSIKEEILENTVTRYNFNVVKIDDKDCLLLDEVDVEFIVTEHE